jgi:Holliday junction resolvasome RuvABC endonuclease subunit
VRLLALDLSTNVGWAFFAQRGASPVMSTWRAPFARAENYGLRFYEFELWLELLLDRYQPDVVAFEAPILPRNPGKAHAARLSYGFAASTERIAYQRKLRCIECHNATVKVRLAGSGKAKKKQMMAAAIRQGYDIETEHEADAIGVGLVAFDHIDPPQLEMAIR